MLLLIAGQLLAYVNTGDIFIPSALLWGKRIVKCKVRLAHANNFLPSGAVTAPRVIGLMQIFLSQAPAWMLPVLRLVFFLGVNEGAMSVGENCISKFLEWRQLCARCISGFLFAVWGEPCFLLKLTVERKDSVLALTGELERGTHRLKNCGLESKAVILYI